MASTFPAVISNEPPPLEVSSEEEDSDDFGSHGLKLDVPSGDPTPVSTPFKRPLDKSPEKRPYKNENSEISGELEENENDSILEIPEVDVDIIPIENPSKIESDVEFLPSENSSPESPKATIDVNGIEKPFNGTRDSEYYFDQEISSTECTSVPTSACNTTATALNNCDTYTNSTTNNNIFIETSGNKDSSLLIVNKEKYSNQEVDLELHEESLNHNFTSKNNTRPPCADVNSPTEYVEDNECINQIIGVQEEDEDDFPDFKGFETFVPSPTCDVVPESIAQFIDENSSKSPVVVEDDFDDDFGAFQSIPNPSTATEFKSNLVTEESTNDSFEEDDFGDFAQVPAQITTNCTSQIVAQSSLDATDDFADFQDCSFQSCDAPAVFAANPSTDYSLISFKVDSIIKSLFVQDSIPPERQIDNLKSIDSEISVSTDNTWARVQDFEGSHGLMFKWLNSLTEKNLLQSLNVETSVIMYHEKFGTIEVPKFAASLVQSPLQPKSCPLMDSQTKSDNHHGMLNNNNKVLEGISCREHDRAPLASTEAQEILRQLPDLSYMRANTLVFPQASPSGL